MPTEAVQTSGGGTPSAAPSAQAGSGTPSVETSAQAGSVETAGKGSPVADKGAMPTPADNAQQSGAVQPDLATQLQELKSKYDAAEKRLAGFEQMTGKWSNEIGEFRKMKESSQQEAKRKEAEAEYAKATEKFLADLEKDPNTAFQGFGRAIMSQTLNSPEAMAMRQAVDMLTSDMMERRARMAFDQNLKQMSPQKAGDIFFREQAWARFEELANAMAQGRQFSAQDIEAYVLGTNNAPQQGAPPATVGDKPAVSAQPETKPKGTWDKVFEEAKGTLRV